MPAPVILVSGISAAGKSTVSRLLAAHFERGAHIEADQLQLMILGGRQWPTMPLEGEGLRQLQLRAKNACLLARSFAEAGFVAVVDDIIVGDRVAEFLAHLEGLDVRFVMLTAPLEVAVHRDRERGKSAYPGSEFLQEAVDAMPRVGLWLDTTDCSAEETAAAIVARLDEAKI